MINKIYKIQKLLYKTLSIYQLLITSHLKFIPYFPLSSLLLESFIEKKNLKILLLLVEKSYYHSI